MGRWVPLRTEPDEPGYSDVLDVSDFLDIFAAGLLHPPPPLVAPLKHDSNPLLTPVAPPSASARRHTHAHLHQSLHVGAAYLQYHPQHRAVSRYQAHSASSCWERGSGTPKIYMYGDCSLGIRYSSRILLIFHPGSECPPSPSSRGTRRGAVGAVHTHTHTHTHTAMRGGVARAICAVQSHPQGPTSIVFHLLLLPRPVLKDGLAMRSGANRTTVGKEPAI